MSHARHRLLPSDDTRHRLGRLLEINVRVSFGGRPLVAAELGRRAANRLGMLLRARLCRVSAAVFYVLRALVDIAHTSLPLLRLRRALGFLRHRLRSSDIWLRINATLSHPARVVRRVCDFRPVGLSQGRRSSLLVEDFNGGLCHHIFLRAAVLLAARGNGGGDVVLSRVCALDVLCRPDTVQLVVVHVGRDGRILSSLGRPAERALHVARAGRICLLTHFVRGHILVQNKLVTFSSV